jgi:hypothetical protein
MAVAAVLAIVLLTVAAVQNNLFRTHSTFMLPTQEGR